MNFFKPCFVLNINNSNKIAQIGALPIVIAVPTPTPEIKTAAKKVILYNIINRPEKAIKTGDLKMAESKFLSNIVAIKNRKIAAKYRRTAPITKGSLYSGISA